MELRREEGSEEGGFSPRIEYQLLDAGVIITPQNPFILPTQEFQVQMRFITAGIAPFAIAALALLNQHLQSHSIDVVGQCGPQILAYCSEISIYPLDSSLYNRQPVNLVSGLVCTVGECTGNSDHQRRRGKAIPQPQSQRCM
jgi:hypothetical protein